MSLMDDSNFLRQQRLFLDQIDQALTANNREVIHAAVPNLDKDTFVKMAKSVALARAAYIEASVRALSKGEMVSPEEADAFEALRKRFEESRSAFDAVKRAINRGYIDVAE